MATLREFAQQQGVAAPQFSTFDLPLRDFATQKDLVSQPPTSLEDFSQKSDEEKGAFRWIGKQLMKSVGVTVKEIRGVGEAIGNLLAIASPKVTAEEGLKAAAKSLGEAQLGAARVLIGQEETSFAKEMEKAGIKLTTFDRIMGLGADIVLDPLNIVPITRIAKGVAKVTRLEKPIQMLSDFVKASPPVQKLKTIFTNTTKDKEFDKVVTKFRSLADYREGRLVDDAIKIQKDILAMEKVGIKNASEVITEALENPAFRQTITDPKALNVIDTLQITYRDLLNQARNVDLKVGEIVEYAPHIRTKESFANRLRTQFGIGAREFGKASVEARRKLPGTVKELAEQGINIFEKNPAIQLVQKGRAFAKAITSQEFALAVTKFAIKDGIDVTHPALKGLKFLPEQAKVIDNYYQTIKPEELKVIIRTFDKVQNWWKAQALISPSYHLRNTASNIWNNYIAGVNPAYYAKAVALQRNALKAPELVDEMKKLGVINEGWYAKDISEEVISRVSKVGKWRTSINPLAQQNALFKLNKSVGSAIENNARMAHYLSMKDKGMSAEQAAQSVKKYLFDYGDLTKVERTIFKRAIPFYTWTRKNIPIQLEGLITQPAKYVLPHKIIEALEAGVEVPDERYMSEYISENIPVRMRKNKDGNWEYFLLGNWLPYATALDVLSEPMQNLIRMSSPLVKTPYEYFANKSTFFRNTLGEPSKVERRYKEQGEFLGRTLRKKNILLLRNIRILNDINKWIDKQDPRAVRDTWMVKFFNTLFGKVGTYDVGKSKYFYDLDTQERITELKKAIKNAERRGFRKKGNELRQELTNFLQLRRGL